MNEPNLQEEEIFKLALKIKPAKARETYLKQVCGENHALFDRLVTLLQAHDEESSFLEKPLSDAIVTEIGPVTEQPGDRIGPFKLLQQIGEGGFGVVYMAEQTKPVRRKVALKIIKPGMDTREVIARFEAERQALALMDHPNIAKVLDAGSTESGRPYFVMELVKGVPLTEYCDKNHLSGTERLKLFVKVCHAIQHAHQKGVIHRDLKPTNIMVTLHDGKPVPKVIDFGVSKALSQQLTEKTLFTAYGQMVGTPAYMSPEQAEMSGLDIDTRSDVYSLGVLLYELLTGSTPFDGKRLRSAGYAEMQRIIREEEPPRPSTRVTTLGEEAGVVSNARGTDPKKLGQLIRGELDWIVMKALDKERNRRYETANGFAADIERFLAHEPVVACPPSATYRIRKFARRNKAAFVATAVSLGVLLAIAIGSTIAAKQFRDLAQTNANLVVEKDDALKIAVDAERKAKRAQRDAEEARDEQKDLRVKAEQQRERATANYALARSAVDQFLNSVTENELMTVPGMHSLRQELLTSALDFYDRFAEDDANADEMKLELARTWYRIGDIRMEFDQFEAQRAAYRKAQQLYQELLNSGDEREDVRLGLAMVHFQLREHQQCIELCEQVLATDPEHVGAIELLGTTYNEQASEVKNQLQTSAALELYRKSLQYRQLLFDKFPDNPDYVAGLGGTINNLGVMLSALGEREEATEMFERSNGYLAQAYLKSPQKILWGNWLCNSLRNTGHHVLASNYRKEALKYFEEVVQIRRRLMIQNQSIPRLRGQLVFALNELGIFQKQMNLAEEANRNHRAALELLESVPRDTPKAMMDLAIVYGSLASPPEGLQGEQSAEWISDQKHYTDQAWKWVREAFDKGFRDVSVLGHQSLKILSPRKEFQELVQVRTQEQIAEEILDGKVISQDLSVEQLSVAEEILLKYAKQATDPIEHQKTMAVLHTAIGVIQIGLSDYDSAAQSLTEVIQRYQQLQKKYPHDLEIEGQAVAVRAFLGQMMWRMGRLPEAHTQLESVLVDLEKFWKNSQIDSKLAKRLYHAERDICWKYGGIGLWEIAGVHAERNLDNRRTEDLVWDSRFAPLLLRGGTEESYRNYCQIYFEKFQANESDLLNDYLRVSHLNYTCGLIENAGVSIEKRVALAERALELRPDNRWVWFCNALTLYRANQYKKALEIVPFPDSGTITYEVAYLHAMIQFQLGNEAMAEQSLQEAEREFLDYCSHPIDERSQKLTGPYSEWWTEFPATHALRAEAHRTIRGVTPPNTDLHLVQARAYHLVGQMELAEREIQSAVESSPELADVWYLQAEHFVLKNDIAQADISWKRGVEIAGDGPEALLKRAEYYAKTGRWDLAKEDALRAVELAPQEARAIFEFCQKAERWSEAAEFGQLLIDQNPEGYDSQFWLTIAIHLALAEDRDGFRAHCERMLQRYQESEILADQQRTSKACLLLPKVIDPTTIPMENVNIVLDESRPAQLFIAGAWSTRALQAYRRGETTLAIEFIEQSASLSSRDPQRAVNQSILAMAYHQLDQADRAKETLEDTRTVIRQVSESPQTSFSSNVLIAKILFREAEAKINGKSAPKSQSALKQ